MNTILRKGLIEKLSRLAQTEAHAEAGVSELHQRVRRTCVALNKEVKEEVLLASDIERKELTDISWSVLFGRQRDPALMFRVKWAPGAQGLTIATCEIVRHRGGRPLVVLELSERDGATSWQIPRDGGATPSTRIDELLLVLLERYVDEMLRIGAKPHPK